MFFSGKITVQPCLQPAQFSSCLYCARQMGPEIISQKTSEPCLLCLYTAMFARLYQQKIRSAIFFMSKDELVLM